MVVLIWPKDLMLRRRQIFKIFDPYLPLPSKPSAFQHFSSKLWCVFMGIKQKKSSENFFAKLLWIDPWVSRIDWCEEHWCGSTYMAVILSEISSKTGNEVNSWEEYCKSMHNWLLSEVWNIKYRNLSILSKEKIPRILNHQMVQGGDLIS